MNVLDLFSGIGGFSIGLERAGFNTIGFCEIKSYCQAVLAKHWPEIPIASDITQLDGNQWRGRADIISAGFPCQDASIGQTQWGKRIGIDGERTGLWREVKRLALEVGPSAIVLENVPGLLSAGFGRVLADLAEIGFDAEWRCIRASTAGFPHRRDRLWIIAYPSGSRLSRLIDNQSLLESAATSFAIISDEAVRTWRSLDNDIDLLRGSDGVPVSAHRRRLEAVGNSIIPQVAQAIGYEILRRSV